MKLDTILLIVAVVIVFILVSIGAYYLLAHYQHPDDKNEAYFPKIVVYFGMILAATTIIGFPLDAENNGEYAGTSSYSFYIKNKMFSFR